MASSSGHKFSQPSTTYQNRDNSVIDLDSPATSRSIASSSNSSLMGKFQSHIQNDGITGKYTVCQYFIRRTIIFLRWTRLLSVEKLVFASVKYFMRRRSNLYVGEVFHASYKYFIRRTRIFLHR